MKRRKVLKSLGLGLSAGLMMPEVLISCKKSDPGPEIHFVGTVAIIGAGAAGLYAADILRSKGISVVILEASSEIGGRIKSYRLPLEGAVPTDSFLFIPGSPSTADFPIELGPEVIEGSDSIWGKIIRDLVIQTYDVSAPQNRYILDNMSKSAADWSADPDFNAVETFVNNLPNVTGSGVSVASSSGVSTRGAALLNSQAGSPYGSNADHIDAGALADGLKKAAAVHDNKRLVLKASLMNDVLKSRFTHVTSLVKFNAQVTSIDYNGGTVTITDKTGAQTTAAKVIVTVPVSVLPQIAFSPALPGGNSASLANLAMDPVIRVILDFKTNFWGDANTGYIFGGTTCPQYFSAAIGRSEQFRTLTITITGDKARELSPKGAGMITDILAELDTVYNNLATTNVRRTLTDKPEDSVIIYTIQDWSKEPFIQGGPSYPKVGASNADRIAIGQQVGNNLFFAGEATAINGDGGTINGALASAERVAEEVVKSITG